MGLCGVVFLPVAAALDCLQLLHRMSAQGPATAFACLRESIPLPLGRLCRCNHLKTTSKMFFGGGPKTIELVSGSHAATCKNWNRKKNKTNESWIRRNQFCLHQKANRTILNIMYETRDELHRARNTNLMHPVPQRHFHIPQLFGIRQQPPELFFLSMQHIVLRY